MDGRSISVCEDWLNFNNFYNWAIKNGYDENVKYGDCTIDRIDVNGNYEPSNCRWVNEKIQQNNRTNNSVFVYNEDKYTIAQLSEISKKHGINYDTLRKRLVDLNWTVEKALNTPVRKRG